MKRKELLQYFTPDELRGRLVGSKYDPDDPNLDVDMSLQIRNLKGQNFVTREASIKWFEHVAHEYDKKDCECMQRAFKALGIKP